MTFYYCTKGEHFYRAHELCHQSLVARTISPVDNSVTIPRTNTTISRRPYNQAMSHMRIIKSTMHGFRFHTSIDSFNILSITRCPPYTPRVYYFDWPKPNIRWPKMLVLKQTSKCFCEQVPEWLLLIKPPQQPYSENNIRHYPLLIICETIHLVTRWGLRDYTAPREISRHLVITPPVDSTYSKTLNHFQDRAESSFYIHRWRI